MAAMAAMFVRSQKVVSVGSSFRTSRFNILRWGDEAVFGAVNLERRSVVGQPCRWLKRAAPKKALTPDKLAAVGTILFGAASPATILRSNKSVSIQAISERTYNKCQTGNPMPAVNCIPANSPEFSGSLPNFDHISRLYGRDLKSPKKCPP
ncbi:uncharacterized protein LOC120842617 isoform X3 [Ixodes scapularis]|uniref:uncharacterized protein LOC120842617 isoform X3 n=1 Tax=Ixodes scapularis TaxID=6945 RepID=UPI001C38094A|nr:uncharacterized protein LOC120842617 isoform X3 [Ixodes scapularis]